MHGLLPALILGAVAAAAMQLDVTWASLVIAIGVMAVTGFAVRRSKAMEAWKETATAAALGRAEAQALAEERGQQNARLLTRVSELEQNLTVANSRPDLSVLQSMLEGQKDVLERIAIAVEQPQPTQIHRRGSNTA